MAVSMVATQCQRQFYTTVLDCGGGCGGGGGPRTSASAERRPEPLQNGPSQRSLIELEKAFETDLRGRSAPFLVCLLVVLSAECDRVFDLHPPWFALSLVCASLPLHSASFFPEIVCIRRLVDGPACACLSTRPLLRVLLLFARSAALFSLSLWLACGWQSPVSWLCARCCCISRARAAATRVRSALFFFVGCGSGSF